MCILPLDLKNAVIKIEVLNDAEHSRRLGNPGSINDPLL